MIEDPKIDILTGYLFNCGPQKLCFICIFELVFFFFFQVEAQSIAGQDGRIREGDQVLQVSKSHDSHMTANDSHMAATVVLLEVDLTE